MTDDSQRRSEVLPMPDAEVMFYRGFFDQNENDRLFEELLSNINWQQHSMTVPGGSVPFPRLTAWYGDEGKTYSYSGLTVNPNAWTPLLLKIKTQVETIALVSFNSVLLNYYRHENDSVSWHSDDEPELGTNPIIASVSFGETRTFQFKHKTNPDLRVSIELTPGSLLIMRGTTQHFWKHQIPKSKKPHGGRINLTFRQIFTQ